MTALRNPDIKKGGKNGLAVVQRLSTHAQLADLSNEDAIVFADIQFATTGRELISVAEQPAAVASLVQAARMFKLFGDNLRRQREEEYTAQRLKEEGMSLQTCPEPADNPEKATFGLLDANVKVLEWKYLKASGRWILTTYRKFHLTMSGQESEAVGVTADLDFVPPNDKRIRTSFPPWILTILKWRLVFGVPSCSPFAPAFHLLVVSNQIIIGDTTITLPEAIGRVIKGLARSSLSSMTRSEALLGCS